MLFVLSLWTCLMGSVEAFHEGKTCDQNPKCASGDFPLSETPSYWIFVSLSQPEASLKKLAQACQGKCRLILRGLKNNSFLETAHVLKDLEIQVDIDPEAFQAFHITSVPTFVKVEKDQEVARLKGDVSFEFAREKLEGAS